MKFIHIIIRYILIKNFILLFSLYNIKNIKFIFLNSISINVIYFKNNKKKYLNKYKKNKYLNYIFIYNNQSFLFRILLSNNILKIHNYSYTIFFSVLVIILSKHNQYFLQSMVIILFKLNHFYNQSFFFFKLVINHNPPSIITYNFITPKL